MLKSSPLILQYLPFFLSFSLGETLGSQFTTTLLEFYVTNCENTTCSVQWHFWHLTQFSRFQFLHFPPNSALKQMLLSYQLWAPTDVRSVALIHILKFQLLLCQRSWIQWCTVKMSSVTGFDPTHPDIHIIESQNILSWNRPIRIIKSNDHVQQQWWALEQGRECHSRKKENLLISSPVRFSEPCALQTFL